MKTQSKRLVAAMDLHSNNVVVAITDYNGKTVYAKRLKNDLLQVLEELSAYSDHIDSIAIESTYNWYWLVDGLKENGYNVKLVNTVKSNSQNTAKHTDDFSDTLHLCRLQRLNDLSTGYIYPVAERPIRDMLRRRALFIKHRTAHLLSLKCLFARKTGDRYSIENILSYDKKRLLEILGDEDSVFIAQEQVSNHETLTNHIVKIEKRVLSTIKLRDEFKILMTIPGIGPILAMTIMLEVGEISRFAKCGNFVSYCRCSPAGRYSNGKKKGTNNRKNGNRYLSWAFTEAVVRARMKPEIQKFYDRKRQKSGLTVVAVKATAAKLCKSTYFVLRDQMEFDMTKTFF